MKRYFFNVVENVDGLIVCPIEDSDGDYVSASDFTALEYQLAEKDALLNLQSASVTTLQKENAALEQKVKELEEWQRQKRERLTNHDAVTLTLHEATKRQNIELVNANAVLEAKLKKCMEQRNQINDAYSPFSEVEIYHMDDELDEITVESIKEQ